MCGPVATCHQRCIFLWLRITSDVPHNELEKMPKLQHLEGNAFYSERDINCFPQFRTLLQAWGRRRDDTWRFKITLRATREAAIKSRVCCRRWTRQMQISPWTRVLLVHLREFAKLLQRGALSMMCQGQSATWRRWSCWLWEFSPFAQLVPTRLGTGTHAAPGADNWIAGCDGE